MSFYLNAITFFIGAFKKNVYFYKICTDFTDVFYNNIINLFEVLDSNFKLNTLFVRSID
jgi:hypothetical protein